MLIGGTTPSLHREHLQAPRVTMTWYQKRFGKSREVTLRSHEATIVHTLPCFAHTLTVLVQIL